MAAEIPALKVSMDSAFVSFSGSCMVPQSDTRRKEGILVCIGPAVWDSVLVLMTSCSSS